FLSRAGARRVLLPARHQRLRQDHDRQHDSRVGEADGGRQGAGGEADRRPRPRPQRGLPGRRLALRLAHRARERRVRPAHAGRPEDDAPRAGPSLPRSGRPHRSGGQAPVRAVGRHEAAHPNRARARQRAEDAAHGRAVRRPRRPDPRRDAGGAAQDLAGDGDVGALHHARHRRGDQPGHASRRDVRGAGLTAQGGGGRGARRRAQPDRRPLPRLLPARVRDDPGRSGSGAAPGAPGRAAMRRLREYGSYAIGFASLFLLWHVAAVYLVQSALFPPPGSVIARAVALFRDGTLVANVAISLQRILTGFVCGSLLGIPIGLAMGSFAPIRRILDPYTEFLRFIPAVAMITVAVIWFGIGETSKLFLIIYATVFVVVL